MEANFANNAGDWGISYVSAERGQSAGFGNPLVALIEGREASRSARRPEKDGLAGRGRGNGAQPRCPLNHTNWHLHQIRVTCPIP
jgi:hypothetical protein